jgi:hypothetical protein
VFGGEEDSGAVYGHSFLETLERCVPGGRQGVENTGEIPRECKEDDEEGGKLWKCTQRSRSSQILSQLLRLLVRLLLLL